jgi:hypothetical protein
VNYYKHMQITVKLWPSHHQNNSFVNNHPTIKINHWTSHHQSNIPVIWVMNFVFPLFIRKFVLLCMVNISVYWKTVEEHVQNCSWFSKFIGKTNYLQMFFRTVQTIISCRVTTYPENTKFSWDSLDTIGSLSKDMEC